MGIAIKLINIEILKLTADILILKFNICTFLLKFANRLPRTDICLEFLP